MCSKRLSEWTLPTVVGMLCLSAPLPANEPSREGVEFFEKRIRPVLTENCYKCHTADKKKGQLLLDSRGTMLKGGETGPAVVPGEPGKSLLVKAIRYQDAELKMPPKGKLAAEHIADFETWIKMGAPWPDDAIARKLAGSKEFNLKERSGHWSLLPIRNWPIPLVKNKSWPASPIDYFVLDKLEAKGLAPAPATDRRTLIRRVTFDLTGLPPAPAEIDAFLADKSDNAFASVVDRLLDSPHYGERWARHWLDLVRFAETYGHEFDFEIPEAWRYRDYVIRAFNADVPYDQLVTEHIAGDLLPARGAGGSPAGAKQASRLHHEKRLAPDFLNESILGTGFWFFGEAKHSPVDSRSDQADRIDNQLDVFGKTFLGLTIACARCHDHKFDAISTRDYYALAGYLQSSRQDRAFVDDPAPLREKVRQLEKIHRQMQRIPDALGKHIVREIEPQTAFTLHGLRNWRKGKPPEGFTEARQVLLKDMMADLKQAAERLRDAVVFADFGKGAWKDWFVTGEAFGTGPTRAGQFHHRGFSVLPGGWAYSGAVSPKLEGTLRSPTFTITKNKIHYHLGGRRGRVNLVLDGLQLIRDPIYGKLTFETPDTWDWATLKWHTQDVSMWLGQRAYIEVIDNGESVVAVDKILFSDGPAPPELPNRLLMQALEDNKNRDWSDLAPRLQSLTAETLRHWLAGTLPSLSDANDRVALLTDLLEGLEFEEEQLNDPQIKAYRTLHRSYREIEKTIPFSKRGLAMCDGSGINESVFVRGSHRNLGEEVPRRFLEVFGAEDKAPEKGSGRLELARRLVDPLNTPIVPRVFVNRLWKHHFGEGIVATPDDFGVLGQPPTHPELLDFLAAQLVKNGWSIKQMHRLILLSSTYQMSSAPQGKAAEVDPQNKLLQHFPIRRLEAEAIRDAMLAVSGRLERTMYGPGVLPHLTPFMVGRGRPSASGPLDGAGRRSIYINVRRNFLTPMFLAFDYPVPFSTMGRRSVSNVPAQALTMMNNPFVLEQAELWAKKVLAEPGRTTQERIHKMYVTALGRPPTKGDLSETTAFLEEQARVYGRGDDPRAWRDLCHVLFNVKEFIYIQ